MIVADERVHAVLADLERSGRENDARETDRARKMLNLERATAELVHLLVRTSRRRRLLEIGTSNGYSTVWLAAALRLTGGTTLVSIDRDAAKLGQARENLARAGLADRVELVEGDATAAVAGLPGPFDCVFFDADRVSAPAQLRLLLPKLAGDALLLADNALSHPDEIAGYVATFVELSEFATMIVPVGKGLHVAFRQAPDG